MAKVTIVLQDVPDTEKFKNNLMVDFHVEGTAQDANGKVVETAAINLCGAIMELLHGQSEHSIYELPAGDVPNATHDAPGNVQ